MTGSAVHGQDLPSGLPKDISDAIRQSALQTPQFEPKAEDPLGYAAALSRMIQGDLDKANACQFRISKALTDAGRSEEALLLAEGIDDYRAALARLHVAGALLSKDSEKKADEAAGHLAAAEGWLGRAKPWQADLILARLCLLGGRLGLEAKRVHAWRDRIADKQAAVGVKVMEKAVLASQSGEFALGEGLEKELEAMAAAPCPPLVESAEVLLAAALAQSSSGHPGRADKLITQALQLLRRSNVAAMDLLLDKAAQMVVAGFEDKARRLFDATQGRLGGDTEQVALLHYKLVRLWKQRGKTENVRTVLEKTETMVRGLRQMDRPYGLAWVAAAWHELDHPQRAGVCIMEAAREAATNVNPRMRVLGAIEICLCHAQTGRPLSPDLLTVLEGIRQRRSDAATEPR